ncbi:MAG: TIGR02680 family protein [Actinomycetota bacterium]|nr:TIGR02680 family protein [Actinomycetota bacterium]
MSPRSAHDERPGRWTLSRAGIINVYQYEHEVLEFGGGRLLLRGVNGSGKSTAMNMLLPFLLTARPGRIDAAGEQVGILKSWMLADRSDPQPVGYLWIEFARAGHYLTCGCGIKANRQSDTVTTWWFVAERRVGIDLHLAEGGTALSADALRAQLDGEEVFPDARRREYRAEVERRLFGGVAIDQHIGLINVVRNPRVGDRIDVDLPDHLRDALPKLSDLALAEAAQPLDDLDDHRRNVAELARTREAVDGLLAIYRAYCTHDLLGRLDTARAAVAEAHGLGRKRDIATRRLADAAAEVDRLEAEIRRLTDTEATLEAEVGALKESSAYQEGQQLDGLRELVRTLQRDAVSAQERAERAEQAAAAAVGALRSAQQRGRDDTAHLDEALATVTVAANALGLSEAGPASVAVAERPLDGIEAAEPTEPFDPDLVAGGLRRVDAATSSRRLDVEEVARRRGLADDAERDLRDADRGFARATETATVAALARDDALVSLSAARATWRDQVAAWDAALAEQAATADHGVSAVALEELSDTDDGAEDAARAQRLADVEAVLEVLEGRLAAATAVLQLASDTEDEARARVAELAGRSEPDPPRLGWQGTTDHCLADLVDFAPGLDPASHAPLEAALEASGLLSAWVSADGSAQLASGDLVAVVSGGVASPLSGVLTATVPKHLLGRVDPGLVTKLLESISCDVDADAPTVISIDGSFRLGGLRGRHTKDVASYVGVTARRAALERARREATAQLDAAVAATAADRRAQETATATRGAARALRSRLPETGPIHTARATYLAADTTAAGAEARRLDADAQRARCETAAATAASELHRVATTLDLPAERDALERFRGDLADLGRVTADATGRARALSRSVEAWIGKAGDWRTARDVSSAEREELRAVSGRLDEQRSRLATIEDAIGIEYAEVVATIERCQADLQEVGDDLDTTRKAHVAAVDQRATANVELRTVTDQRDSAEGRCEADRRRLVTVVGLPGVFDAVAGDGDTVAVAPASAGTGAAGLQKFVDDLAAMLPPTTPDAPGVDGVHQSLRGRRDALGAGWDAEARQPDPLLPLTIEVNGPTGRAALPAATRAIAAQHRQLAGLLNAKQDAALRELLQGLIARDVAEKVHGAGALVTLMNERLATVRTAHEIGVRLRWRPSPELDPETARMADLLGVVPDLRTEDDDRELRQLLSARLDEARRLQPDVPYRQLIAATLDYKQWHELSVIVRRGERESVLGRRTQLSEGEKKVVTYLPLFAAVAASCDALAAAASAPGEAPLGIPRFVLLDDAFAKVSEDNHAKLFGLLVDLDLDLIATSERLWGTHASVPELAIVEVVRDAAAGVILLEHFRWDGRTLERLASP